MYDNFIFNQDQDPNAILPQLNPQQLCDAYLNNTHHQACLKLKIDLISSLYQDNPYLNYSQFVDIVTNYLIYGNSFITTKVTILNTIRKVQALPTRVIVFNKNYQICYYNWQNHVITKTMLENSFHLSSHKISDPYYGQPTYTSCLQSLKLYQQVNNHRENFYKRNNASANLIVCTGDTPQEDTRAVSHELRKRGNSWFSKFLDAMPLFVHTGTRNDNSSQAFHNFKTADEEINDDFAEVKNNIIREILTAHRVPAPLIYISSRGNKQQNELLEHFIDITIKPILKELTKINSILNLKVIEFKDTNHLLSTKNT